LNKEASAPAEAAKPKLWAMSCYIFVRACMIPILMYLSCSACAMLWYYLEHFGTYTFGEFQEKEFTEKMAHASQMFLWPKLSSTGIFTVVSWYS